MTMSVEDAIALARILKAELNSMRVSLHAHEARIVGLESGAANAELERQIDQQRRQIDELKKQLQATGRSAFRSMGGGA